MAVRVIEGDCVASLRTLPNGAAQCCVTSPPYYGLRDYGHAGQIGLEDTPDAYVARLVDVFREVRRVLRDDGVLWLNLGDSYAAQCGAHGGRDDNQRGVGAKRLHIEGSGDQEARRPVQGYKPKDLIGIPWMVAFALRADGWWLRSDCIWAKPNPMPESVRDRPTKAHEYVFLLTKSARYFYDAEAIAEPFADERMGASGAKALHYSEGAGRHDTLASDGKPGLGASPSAGYRNARTVWTIATQPFAGAHFATMPPDLAERCIKAGSSEKGQCPHCGSPWQRVVEIESRPNAPSLTGKYNGDGKHRAISGGVGNDARARVDKGWSSSCDCPAHQPVPQTILDPFGGAGTTGLVADRLGRNAILCELNPEYARLARERITADAPLLAECAA